MDRDAALESEPEPGDWQKLRAADAEAFLIQLAVRRVPGVSRAGTENGLRRRTGRARPRKVARTGSRAPMAARGQADDHLLQSYAPQYRRPLPAKPGEALQRSA